MTKCVNPPHSNSCQYGDEAPLKAHMSRGGGGGGGSGFTLTGALEKLVEASRMTLKKTASGHQRYIKEGGNSN